jgi:phage FluMu protein Com
LHYTINAEIKQELEHRGFKVNASNTRKSILRFEESELSRNIFNEIYDKSFIWVILNLISRENLIYGKKLKLPITFDQIQQIIFENNERLKLIMDDSPDRNLLCNRCFEVIFRYNNNFDKKPNIKIKCPKCNALNELDECKESNDWNFPSLPLYLEKMIKNGILSSSILGSCPQYCKSINIIPYKFDEISTINCTKLRKFVTNLYCDKCGNFLQLGNIYNVTDLISSIWMKEDIWMEWYIKNIIKYKLKIDSIEQGLNVINNGSTQTDVILLKDSKIISCECKDFGLGKNIKFEDVSEVLNYIDFSDEVFLVILTKLTENDKIRLLKRGNNKLKIIEHLNIKRLIEYIH